MTHVPPTTRRPSRTERLREALRSRLDPVKVSGVVFHGVLRTLKRAMQSAGYTWEERAHGATRLGLWRNAFRQVPAPRRLVCVPGFGDSPVSWLPVFTALSPVLRRHFDEIVFVDLPGFAGWLSKEDPFTSMDGLLQAIDDLMQELTPHTVFGHSLGGWLMGHAASAATRQRSSGWQGPQRVVLACPAGLFESDEARQLWEEKFRRTLTQGFASFRGEVFASEPVWFGLLVPEFERFMSHPGTQAFMNSIEPRHLLTSRLGTLASDVWLIFAERDSLAPVERLPAWREALSAASGAIHSVVISGSGHSPQLEKPAVTMAVLGQILAGRTPVHRQHSRGRFYAVK